MVLVVVGLGVFLATRNTGPDHPDEWDARVVDIVAFDERERGLDFKHPVEVEFMTDEDFEAAVTTSESELTDEDRAQIGQLNASFRALGLIGGDVDVFEEGNDIAGDGTLAYYSSEDEKVRVRGTELDVAMKVTLAHELVHALQDQHFDLDRLDEMETDGEASAFRAIVEGDAVNVENAYIEQLSEGDLETYEAQSAEQGEAADYADQSEVLVATTLSPYIVGPPFVAALEARGGNAGIDEALRNPPQSEAALLDLFAFLDDEVPVSVEPASPPDGEEVLDEGDFGATTWFLMLARRLDVHEAVDAVDGWAGDSYVTYAEADGRVCVKARYQGMTQVETDQMYDRLTQWLGTDLPEGSGVVASGSFVELTSCDPGSDAELIGTDRSLAAIGLLGLRLQVLSEAFAGEADDALAECASNGLVDALTLDDLDPDADQDAVFAKVQEALTASIGRC